MFLPSSLSQALTRVQLDPVDESLWYPVPPPSATFSNEPTTVGVNLGLTFTVQVVGSLHTLCYYRASSTMSATGTMALWQIDHFTDVLLASVNFTGHSGTGWQTVVLPEPIKVNASHGYVVHLWLPSNGTYAVETLTEGFFNGGKSYYSMPWNFINGVVSAGNNDYRGFVKRNGLIGTGAFARPVEGFEGGHYWVDVIVNARPVPPPPDPPLILKWPIPAGWPSAETTGPDPDTVFAEPELDVYNVTADGEIIENRDFRAGISNTYQNVIIRNCLIRGQGNYIIYNQLGANGTLIEDCFIDGVGRQNAGCTGIALGGINMTVQRCNIQRVENAVTLFGKEVPVNIIIKDNFIHHLRSAPGLPHYDGLQLDGGGTTMTIEHNTIMNEQVETSCIMLDNYGGPMDDIVIKDNVLFGGGYTCYYTDNFFATGNPLTNVSYLRNLMHVGVHAYFLISLEDPASEEPTMQGNQFLTHGAVFDNPPPGGFVTDQVVPESIRGYSQSISGSIIGELVDVETGGLTLGTAFQMAQAGQISSINFARPSFTSTQTVQIGIWRFTGSTLTGGVELLGSQTYTNFIKTGLQNLALTTPIDVEVGDNLLVGVFIPRGSDGKCWYFAESGFFWPDPVPSQWSRMTAFANNPGVPLSGFAGGNGLYHYGPALTAPTSASGLDTWYWVDPVFVTPWV